MSELMDFQIPEANNDAIIKVVGVGGGGGNAVNHMYHEGIKDVEFMICNTDAQALKNSDIPIRIQLGASLTEGRGAGNKPEIGKEAAKESYDRVKEILSNNTKMVFVTAGMGGGTGTGAAPVIASIAKELEILTIGIVTLPFKTEGKKRLNQALEGIQELKEHVDSLLVINNERIKDLYVDFPISEAFKRADGILSTAAKGIAEIITITGFINVDFADVVTVMKDSGVAIMGSATASGAERAEEAIKEALNSPLLNDNNIQGAKNILVNIYSGDPEATMSELNTITEFVQDSAGYDADLIWGNGQDPSLGENIRVTVIATGFDESCIPTPESIRRKPAPKRPVDSPVQPQSAPQNRGTEQGVNNGLPGNYQGWGNPVNQAPQERQPVAPQGTPYTEQQNSDWNQHTQQGHGQQPREQVSYDPNSEQYQRWHEPQNQAETMPHGEQNNQGQPTQVNTQPNGYSHSGYEAPQPVQKPVEQQVVVEERKTSPLADRYESEYNSNWHQSTQHQHQSGHEQAQGRGFQTEPQPMVIDQELPAVPNQVKQAENFDRGVGQPIDLNLPPTPPAPRQTGGGHQQTMETQDPYREERMRRSNMKRNFHFATEEELDAVESVPAYKRKNRTSFRERQAQQSNPQMNRPTNAKPQINSNNSYLHDNVD